MPLTFSKVCAINSKQSADYGSIYITQYKPLKIEKEIRLQYEKAYILFVFDIGFCDDFVLAGCLRFETAYARL